MAAYNTYAAPPPVYSGQPPPPAMSDSSYGGAYPQHGVAPTPAYPSGDNSYQVYSSGYPASYSAPTAPYQHPPQQQQQWSVASTAYPQQQPQEQTAAYSAVAYPQPGATETYSYAGQSYGYQGYSYDAQGYQQDPGQTAAANQNAPIPVASWDPNQAAAWSAAPSGGGQGAYVQNGMEGGGYTSSSGGYNSSSSGYNSSRGSNGTMGRGASRGRGDARGGGGAPWHETATSKGWGFGEQGPEPPGSEVGFHGAKGGGAIGGRGSARGRGCAIGRGGVSWQGTSQAAATGDNPNFAQGPGFGLEEQGSGRGRGGWQDRGRGGAPPGKVQGSSGRGGGTSDICGGGYGFNERGRDAGFGGGPRGRGGYGGDRGRGGFDGDQGGVGRGQGNGGDRGRGGFDRGRGDGGDRGRGGFDRGRGDGGDRGRGGFDRGRGDGGNRGRGGFDRGRGDRGDRGRAGFDRGRGGFDGVRGDGGDRGRGGFDRGRGGSDRGRGGGDRGRGGGDRGRGGGDRGRGFTDRGRGRSSSDRGRGVGSRGGMGNRGRGFADRGRGRDSNGGVGRGRGSDQDQSLGRSEALFTSSTGVGLSSLSDVIKSAKSRQMFHVEVDPFSPTDSLNKMVAHWKTFTGAFTDCGNAITTMECSLTACKVRFLQLDFTSEPLTQCNHYCIFTGCLYVKKVADGQPTEIAFLARGLGLTKKVAKLDAYQKAYNLLMHSTVAEIFSQEDTNESALIEEVTCLFNEDPAGFMALLKKCNTEGQGGTQAMVMASRKRTAASVAVIAAKRPRLTDKTANMLEASATSLVPKKQVDLVMNPTATLFDKLTKLKQLLKEEGITKLHIVPKIDQLGNKSAMNIKNVYRFLHAPHRGMEDETPVICEVYFDNVLVSSGDPSVKYNTAMHSAYTLLAGRLCKEPLDSIVHCSSYWIEYMVNEPDVCQVMVKRPGEDNDSLLTSNLANMKQMMQGMPDFSIPLDRFVIMQFEADLKMDNHYKMLELSATRNCMLLECEIVRNPEQSFTCIMSMQGRQLCIRTNKTKIGAKRSCSDAIIEQFTKTNDIVFVGKDVKGPVYTRTQLVEEAKKAKEAGMEPLKFSLEKEDLKPPTFKNAVEAARWEEDRRKAKEIDSLLENVADRPYIPWMAKLLAGYILDYHKSISLMDLQVHLHDMPKSMRDMVQIISSKMGLRTVSKLKDGDNAILRRSVPAIEVTKILGINNGESGRFKMKQCKNPWSAEELEKYKKEVSTKYTDMYENLINNTKTEPEIKTVT